MEQTENATLTYALPTESLSVSQRMKKSEIVGTVMSLRTGVATNDKKIIKSLASVLKYRSMRLQQWDEEVEANLAQGIIRHITAGRGELTLQALVGDIDILLRRAV